MTTNTPHPDRRLDRRTVLTTLTGALTTLAGCSRFESNDVSTTDTSQDTVTSPPLQTSHFTQVEFEGGGLKVVVADNSSADLVELRDPSGETALQSPLDQEQSTVNLGLVGPETEGYTPGPHTLIAKSVGETLEKTVLDLYPDVEITDLRWAKRNPGLEWDKDSSDWEQYSAVFFENSGSAPAFLTQLQWSDTPRLMALTYDSVETQPQMVLPPEETTVVYSRWPTFATEIRGSSVDCSELDSSPFSVTAELQVAKSSTISKTVRYSGSQYSCNLSLGGSAPTTASQSEPFES